MLQLIVEALQYGRESLVNIQHYVETRIGLIDKATLEAACESLVHQGRVAKFGNDYQLAAPVPQPTIRDHTQSLLLGTRRPLSLSEIASRVGSVTGRPVSPYTIRQYLSDLRQQCNVRSYGRCPTRYRITQ